MQNKVMKSFLLAAFAATLFTAPVNASNTFAIYTQKEVKTCKIPPAIQEAYNAVIQKFGRPTSANLVSCSQQGNVYTVVAVFTFSYGSVKTLNATFSKDGSVLYYTLK